MPTLNKTTHDTELNSNNEIIEPTEPSKPHGWTGAIGSAALFVLSIVFIIGGIDLGLGTPFRLGTGAFPFITGVILGVLSSAIFIQDIRGNGLAETPDWISFLAICASISTFALCADRFGLIPAAFLATVIASAPDKTLAFKGKILLGAIVACSSWLLFIEALNLPFKTFVGL